MASGGIAPANEVEQREEKNPDDVDKMPVETADVERRVVVCGEAAAGGHDDEDGENAEADDHVKGVQAGHKEIEDHEHLDLRLVGTPAGKHLEGNARDDVFKVIVIPLEIELDADEREAEEHREDEPGDDGGFAFARLGGMDGHDHGQAAANENGGVGGAKFHFEQMAADFKGLRMKRAVDDVGAEKSAKKHDFGDEESPHAEGVGVALLFDSLELMRDRRRAWVVEVRMDGHVSHGLAPQFRDSCKDLR